MTDKFDYSEYRDGPGGNILAQISAVADEQKELEQEIAQIELELKAAKERHRVVSESTLPELMETAGMSELTTLNGLVVTLGEKVLANISAERAPEAHAWLINNGHEALIKNEYVVSFPKNSTEIASEFEKYLNDEIGRKANRKHKVAVHPSTLTAFVNEELEAGRELPMELLGVMRRKVTKIK